MCRFRRQQLAEGLLRYIVRLSDPLSAPAPSDSWAMAKQGLQTPSNLGKGDQVRFLPALLISWTTYGIGWGQVPRAARHLMRSTNNDVISLQQTPTEQPSEGATLKGHNTVHQRKIGTGISETSTRVPIFLDVRGSKQVVPNFRQRCSGYLPSLTFGGRVESCVEAALLGYL